MAAAPPARGRVIPRHPTRMAAVGTHGQKAGEQSPLPGPVAKTHTRHGPRRVLSRRQRVVRPRVPAARCPAHNDRMTLVWYAWRASRWQMWRTTLLVMIIGGLLGTVALGAVAAARRTDSAYGRYLHAVNASDVTVNVPGPFLPVIKAIERAPGTT